jgi:hypothetical protein
VAAFFGRSINTLQGTAAMDLILLFIAIKESIKRPEIAGLSPVACPNVPADKFEEWKQLELRRRDLVIRLGFGWIGVEVFLGMILWGYDTIFGGHAIASVFGGLSFVVVISFGLPALLVISIMSNGLRRQADAIREQYDIEIEFERDWRGLDERDKTHRPKDNECLSCGTQMQETDEKCPSCGWSYENDDESYDLASGSDDS